MHLLTGITRVRNESLILEDTLWHFLGICDRVIVYDDDSTDNTPEIAASFDGVHLIRGDAWRRDRRAEETRHRSMMLSLARTDWVLCFDADERLEGPLPALTGDGFRFRLFDGYMTNDCAEPYQRGALIDLPRMWGPERRDILMLFRKDRAQYVGMDKREPAVSGNVALADTCVRHYGKCLSVEHWEETCDYYANHWPDPYRSKWAARRGKAIHTESDFGRPLYPWEQVCEF